MSRDRVVGLALVTVGVILLVVLQFDLAATIVPALVGAGFLGVYALTRRYEFLVPGGLLTGFGSGFVIEVEIELPGTTLFGFGVGFLFVALLDRLATGGRAGGWWPLLPGATLAAVGVIQFAEAQDVLVAAADWWPLLLVGAGFAALLRPGPAVERDEPGEQRPNDTPARS